MSTKKDRTIEILGVWNDLYMSRVNEDGCYICGDSDVEFVSDDYEPAHKETGGLALCQYCHDNIDNIDNIADTLEEMEIL